MKKLLLPILSLVLLLTACYDKDIQEINNRLDLIENQKIATLNEQIEAINKTIPLLSEVDEQLSEHISSVEETSNKEIAALKDVNTSLKNQIAELEKYVNEQLSKTTDWVNGTFATLEQYKAVTEQLEKIKTQVDNIKPELLDVISKSEETLKTWVSEQLTDYYKIAEIDAKLESIDKKIKEGDEENAKALKELKEQLEKDKTEITEAYQKAIKEAIDTNNGEIDKKISKEIEAVNKRIDEEVKAINTKISDLEARIKAIEDKLDEILGRKLDITFDVEDDVAIIAGSTCTINYSIDSSDDNVHIATIAQNGWNAYVTAETDNSGYITVLSPNPLTNSPIVVFVSNTHTTIMRTISFVEGYVVIDNSSFALDNEETTLTFNIQSNLNYTIQIPESASYWITLSNNASRATISKDTIKLLISKNTEATARNAIIEILHNNTIVANIKIYQRSLEIANNEIIYTTTDGKILEPYSTNAFNAKIIHNSYTNGYGLIVFDNEVKGIGSFAFYNCKKLNSIHIPNSVIEIGNSAFRNSGLKSIELSKNLTSIKNDAFYETLLNEIDIPDKVQDIGSYAFYNCTYLTKAILPENLITIESGTFKGCNCLSDITIPNNVKEIGSQAFEACYLKSITWGDNIETIGWCAFAYNRFSNISIPDSVITIESYAFENCSQLTSATISDSVQVIDSAFSQCHKLNSITIGSSVISMNSSFYNCPNLNEIYCKPTTPPNINNSTFNGIATDKTIYVPHASVDAYKNAQYWSNYADCIVGYDF